MDEQPGERIRVYLSGTVLNAVVVSQDGTTTQIPALGHHAATPIPRAECPAEES